MLSCSFLHIPISFQIIDGRLFINIIPESNRLLSVIGFSLGTLLRLNVRDVIVLVPDGAESSCPIMVTLNLGKIDIRHISRLGVLLVHPP